MVAKILDFRLFESLKNAFPSIHRKLNVADMITRTSIIVYLIPHHFSWFKNYKLYWFPNLFLALHSLVSKQVLLSTQIYSSWWGWWRRTTHAPTFVPSSQNFHIEFVKSDRLENLINIWHSRQDYLKKMGDFRKKRDDGNCPLQTWASRSKLESWNIWLLTLF